MFLIRSVLAFGWLKKRYGDKELPCTIKITMISAVLATIFSPRPDLDTIIQERAYSPPIWVN